MNTFTNIKKIIIKIRENNKSNSIEKEIKYNSDIMKEGEFDMIKSAIKSRMNMEIKGLKKLYQATIDGENAVNFHKKCDKIPNTLIIIKTNGNRRFGGFTSEVWESDIEGKQKEDKNAFLFSLDKQKIYPIKNYKYAIYVKNDYGPTFGFGTTVYISSNPIKTRNSFSFESFKRTSYEFFGDNDALSGSGPDKRINLKEYEVFQVIF